jgi:hypothetical protein
MNADPKVNALLLVTLTPHIRAYLEATDPQALKQIKATLVEAGVNPDPDPEAAQTEFPDFRDVHVVGVSSRSGVSTKKIVLAELLMAAGRIAADPAIDLYVTGFPLEKLCWQIVGHLQNANELPVRLDF